MNSVGYFRNYFYDARIHGRQVPKSAQISSSVKIRPVGAELFHASGRTDGRTDMTRQVVAFPNFSSRINIPHHLLYTVYRK